MTDIQNAPELYKLVQEENWVKVRERADKFSSEAKYVDITGLTPLHLAVICRKTSNPSARLGAIQALLQAAPSSSLTKTITTGFTPLHYAAQVVDLASMEDDLQIVKLILETNKGAASILTTEGLSALDVHIIAVSKLKRQEMTFSSSRPGRGGKSSSGGGAPSQKTKTTPTALLKALLAEHTTGLAKPLEILLECNSLAVLEQVALEEAQASSSKLRARRQARAKGEGASVMSALSTPSGSTNFSTFWVWEWALVLLKSDFAKRHANTVPTPSFQPLHAAAQVKDCPLAFLILSMRAYPQQVRTPADDIHGNLPLHTVAGWDVTDPSSVSRKSMALSTLVSEYPQASKVRNKQGKTPLSLALETGTSWDNGVRRLTSFQRENSFRSTGAGGAGHHHHSRQSSYAHRATGAPTR